MRARAAAARAAAEARRVGAAEPVVRPLAQMAVAVRARAEAAKAEAARAAAVRAAAAAARAMEVAATAGWPASLPGRRIRFYTRKLGFP